MSSVEEPRSEVRGRLRAAPTGEPAVLPGRDGPGRGAQADTQRLVHEWDLAAAGRACAGRPGEYGGRAASAPAPPDHAGGFDVLRMPDGIAAAGPTGGQRLFPISRADADCADANRAGSVRTRRTTTAERVLGLPKEARP
ncbi:hypothetical protein FB563_7870 [Streptomyces puniciscabiei]|uniref:Uncharacterized protein n=1 Tax=Streptomyces puniciscabiei TaxID=164348 RepID=A0A542SY52_9ACTN|nr:hypothetical protein [Streptomyces puniciscabiei]TQK79534.1 hypothetical protein FB563_7870 [Streptomyces puniciscabiei]